MMVHGINHANAMNSKTKNKIEKLISNIFLQSDNLPCFKYACTQARSLRKKKKKKRTRRCGSSDYDYESSLTSTFRFFRYSLSRIHILENRLGEIMRTLDPSVDTDCLSKMTTGAFHESYTNDFL
jgi:hypothetical protein